MVNLLCSAGHAEVLRHIRQRQMRAGQSRFLRRAVCRCAAVLALACGCGREPVNKTDRYVPAPELCRAAVEAVLADWKDGLPAEPIDRLPVTVNVVDQHRKPGQALAAFEILGETPSASGRCLIVRLRYNQPEGEETVRYVVVGIDPLWVFRQEDFELMNQWDHPMPPGSAAQAGSETGETADPTDEQDRDTVVR